MGACKACHQEFESWVTCSQNYSKVCPSCLDLSHECACGCGEEIPQWQSKGKRRKWVNVGHSIRGTRNPMANSLATCSICGVRYERSKKERRSKKRVCPTCWAERTICKICGQDIPKYDTHGDTRHTCSRSCRGKYNAPGVTGPEHPSWKRKPVPCTHCSAPLMIAPYEARKYENHFCNTECKAAWQQNYYIDNVHPRWIERVVVPCTSCGAVLEREARIVERNEYYFCDQACHSVWKSANTAGPNSPHWRGGISFDPYPPEFNGQLKRTIRDRDNHTCQLCGATRNEVGRELDIHHINYDKQDCRHANLITLCASCNAKCNYGRKSWQRKLMRLQFMRRIVG